MTKVSFRAQTVRMQGATLVELLVASLGGVVLLLVMGQSWVALLEKRERKQRAHHEIERTLNAIDTLLDDQRRATPPQDPTLLPRLEFDGERLKLGPYARSDGVVASHLFRRVSATRFDWVRRVERSGEVWEQLVVEGVRLRWREEPGSRDGRYVLADSRGQSSLRMRWLGVPPLAPGRLPIRAWIYSAAHNEQEPRAQPVLQSTPAGVLIGSSKSTVASTLIELRPVDPGLQVRVGQTWIPLSVE